MKSKIITSVITTLSAIGCSVGLAACGEHEHAYTTRVVDPTCVESGHTLHICDCGREYKDKVTSPTGEHDYEGYVCSVCYAIDENAPVNEELSYHERMDGDTVVSYGVGSDEAINAKYIKIPSEHDGKPVNDIYEGAFDDCAEVISIYISQGMITLGDFAFSGCVELKRVDIPDSVTTVRGGTFMACRKLGSITIPSSVTSIDLTAFLGCDSLTEIKYAGTLAQWQAIELKRSGYDHEWAEENDLTMPEYAIVCSDGTLKSTDL